MNYQHIANEARRLQVELWMQRKILFASGEPTPLQLLNPEVAARVCSVEYEYRDRIGGLQEGFEAAGVLNRERNIISVSTRFPHEVQRYTGAHEIGHLVLHANIGLTVVHRDRPVTPHALADSRRPEVEREADYFAACFLAPQRIVVEQFQKRFGRAPLTLDETVAFHLGGKLQRHLMTAPPGSLDFAAAVAGAESFDRGRFPSMAQHFGISVPAMAIRLRELHLVESY